jgi:hypothetical protein
MFGIESFSLQLLKGYDLKKKVCMCARGPKSYKE